jgi:hypothetical protein
MIDRPQSDAETMEELDSKLEAMDIWDPMSTWSKYNHIYWAFLTMLFPAVHLSPTDVALPQTLITLGSLELRAQRCCW